MFLSYLTNSPSSLLPQKFSKRSSTFLSFWTITLRTQPHQPPTTSLRNEKRVWQQPNFWRENCPAFPHAKIQRYFRSRLYLEVYKSLKGKCETCRRDRNTFFLVLRHPRVRIRSKLIKNGQFFF